MIRLIHTAIILTMLAQPAVAYTVEALIAPCTKWKESGFSDTVPQNNDGLDITSCAAHFEALRVVGSQMCIFPEDEFRIFGWEASSKQLVQFVLNQAEELPALWDRSTYAFLILNSASTVFPCRE